MGAVAVGIPRGPLGVPWRRPRVSSDTERRVGLTRTLEIYQPAEGITEVSVPSGGPGEAAAFAITRTGKKLTLEARTPLNWRILLVNNSKVQLLTSGRIENTPRGALVTPGLGAKAIQIEL